MIKLAHRVGLPFLRADAAFSKDSNMNKKSYLARVRLPRTPADWLEAMMNFIFFLCGMLAVGCVVLITVYMVLSGVPAIHKIGLFRFLLGIEWASTAADPKFGILPFILSSVYGTLGATLIGVPIGLLTAVFLSKAAGPKVRTVVVTAIELLSGIPSVVFGLLGMQVLVPAVAKTFGKASGACLLSAIVVLSIMILPSIVSVSVTALNAVPPEYEQGSLALGATDTETWFKISVPAAKSGIAAGIVLGIGRAIGEAMAVMMVAGNSPNMPDSLFRSVTFLTTAIAKEMSYAGGQQQRLCIARALAVKPEVLLMDEPTSALDPGSTMKVEELMSELKKNYTVVIVTHNMQQAARISDRTAFFLLGELVEVGPTNQIFSAPQDKRTEDYISGRFG